MSESERSSQHTPVEMQGGNGTFLAEIPARELADEKGIPPSFLAQMPAGPCNLNFARLGCIKTEREWAKAASFFLARAASYSEGAAHRPKRARGARGGVCVGSETDENVSAIWHSPQTPRIPSRSRL